MKLSIIVVSWNVKGDLLNCLGSIRNNPPSCQYEVIVVDNASSDGTVDALRQQFPLLRLIDNKENRGFAGANNQGLDVACGQYIFFLNPDTIVTPRSIDVLLRFMEDNPDVGACGPKLTSENGIAQHTVRCFPSFAGALHRHTIFKALGIFRPAYNKWLMKGFSSDSPVQVDQLIGAALMVRREAMEDVGKMDHENFFMYYEEVDLCYRMKKAGWRTMFVPYARIVHLGGRSSGQIPAEKTLMAMSSLLKFLKKHRSAVSFTVFSWVFKTAFVLNEIMNLLLYSLVYVLGLMSLSSKTRTYAGRKLRYSGRLLKLTWMQRFG